MHRNVIFLSKMLKKVSNILSKAIQAVNLIKVNVLTYVCIQKCVFETGHLISSHILPPPSPTPSLSPNSFPSHPSPSLFLLPPSLSILPPFLSLPRSPPPFDKYEASKYPPKQQDVKT